MESDETTTAAAKALVDGSGMPWAFAVATVKILTDAGWTLTPPAEVRPSPRHH